MARLRNITLGGITGPGPDDDGQCLQLGLKASA
jgi:hypothetical protein